MHGTAIEVDASARTIRLKVINALSFSASALNRSHLRKRILVQYADDVSQWGLIQTLQSVLAALAEENKVVVRGNPKQPLPTDLFSLVSLK